MITDSRSPEDVIRPCPSCNSLMAIIETQDGLLYKCGYCGDELPVIILDNISD